jgi:hypothetical protein
MIGFKTRSEKMCAGLLAFVCIAQLFLLSQERRQSPPPKEEEVQQTSTYQLLAKGVVSSAPFGVQFKSAALKLEMRNLVMGHGETESIPTPTRMLLEVRQGGVITIIDHEKMNRTQGDFWVVDKDSRFSIQNPGQVAVLRAIYIFEGSH